MWNPEGESDRSPLRPCFDRRLKLELHGSRVTSDAGLLAYRELDDALGLTALAGDVLADSRTGKNGWHGVVGLLRQSVYGRLAGYEDVNDAERLGRDPAMRWIVDGKAVERGGASTSQMGRLQGSIVNGGGIMLHARRPGGPVAAAHNCATHGPLSVATRGRRCTAWSSMRRFDWRLSTRV